MFSLWKQGRQNGGYKKLRLFVSTKYKFDLYLIRYDKGDYITTHVDPSPEPGLAHYRFNLVLWKAKEGGQEGFFMPLPIFQWGRLYFLRPDITPHHVTPVMKGRRYVLSFGFLGRPAGEVVVKYAEASDLDNGTRPGKIIVDEKISEEKFNELLSKWDRLQSDPGPTT